MKLTELSKAQIASLKRNYLLITKPTVTWQELDQAEHIVSMKELKAYYKDAEFSDDDFGFEDERKCYSY